jgi:hypothetical protein
MRENPENKKRKVRPSEVDRMMLCKASIHIEDDDVLIDHESGDAAKVGSAVHAVMKTFLSEKMKDIPDVTPYALAEGIEEKIDKVRIYSYLGRKFLHEKGYAKYLSDEPLLEESLKIDGPEGTNYYFSLRADVLDYVVGTDGVKRIFVYDYKTGDERPDRETLGQMKSYAYAGLEYFELLGQADEIVVVLAWLQTGNETVRKYTPEEIVQFAEELPKFFEWDGKTFTPGTACRWCPRVASCEGRVQLLSSGVDILSGDSPKARALVPYKPGKIVDVEAWGRAIVQAKLLRNEIDHFLVDSLVAAKIRGGEVHLPDGQKIRVRSRKGGTRLDPTGTLKELARLKRETNEASMKGDLDLTVEDVVSFSKLNKKGVEDFIKGFAPRGEKGKLIEQVFGELESKGHLTHSRNQEWVEVV